MEYLSKRGNVTLPALLTFAELHASESEWQNLVVRNFFRKIVR